MASQPPGSTLQRRCTRRRWGFLVRSVEPTSAFCELCGAPGLQREGDLQSCPRCDVLACAACRTADDICEACAQELRIGAWRARLGTVAGASAAAPPATALAPLAPPAPP